MLNQKLQKMSNQIMNSEYAFTSNYTDKAGRNCKAKIILKVNYDSKSYVVIPFGTSRDEFGFLSNSNNNYEMWKAVLQLINEAIDFGESLVNPPATIDDVISNIDVKE